MSRLKIAVHVPPEAADAVRKAMGEAGAGIIGEYSFCSYTVTGVGRYRASKQANPYIGDAGQMNAVEEERIEVTCDRSDAKAVVAAIRSVHPYEEPTYDIYPLIDEDDL